MSRSDSRESQVHWAVISHDKTRNITRNQAIFQGSELGWKKVPIYISSKVLKNILKAETDNMLSAIFLLLSIRIELQFYTESKVPR